MCDLHEMLDRAARFYGPSIDFSQVTVMPSRVAFRRRPWTANNVIRLAGPLPAAGGSPSNDRPGGRETPDCSGGGGRSAGSGSSPGSSCSDPSGRALATLIHELAHVWQYQNGNLQLLRGVAEQVNHQLGRDPYDYGGAAGVREAVAAGAALTSFSNESQAQIVEDYWSALNVAGATGYRGEAFTPAYVDDLRALVAGAGIGTRVPVGPNPVETAAGRLVNRVAGWLEPVVGAFGE